MTQRAPKKTAWLPFLSECVAANGVGATIVGAPVSGRPSAAADGDDLGDSRGPGGRAQRPAPTGLGSLLDLLSRVLAFARRWRKSHRSDPSLDGTKKATEEIVRDLKRGHNPDENFKLLFDHYYRRIFGFVTKLSGNILTREDAEDLTSEILVCLWQGLPELRDETKFEAFLVKMAKHKCIDKIRRHHGPAQEPNRAGPLDVLMDRAASTATDPEEVRRYNELKEKVRQILQEMPSQRRRCMMLRLDGDSIKEIAFTMRLSAGAVKAHLHQARNVLREKLGPDYGDSLRSLSDDEG